MGTQSEFSFVEVNLSWFHGKITGQSIIFLGGLFLLYKSVTEIHHKLEGEEELENRNTKSRTKQCYCTNCSS
jgi:predicted tellurium resistance membrane protein TerC